MKYRHFSILLFVLFLSCRKDENEPIKFVNNNKIPVYPWRVIEHCIDESTCKKYSYTPNNRLASIKVMKDGSEIELITYTYSGNIALRKSTSNKYQYTYFLNSKGLADSCQVIFPGLLSIMQYFTYTTNFKLIKKKEIGTVVSVPYQQEFQYFYEGENMILEKITEDGAETIIKYEHDLSFQNRLDGTEFMENFLPPNNYPITKAIYNEDEEEMDIFNFTLTEDSIITRDDLYSNGTRSMNTYYLEKVN
jgi:hypothetical protein